MFQSIIDRWKIWRMKRSDDKRSKRIHAEMTRPRFWRVVSPTATVDCGMLGFYDALKVAKLIGPIAFTDHEEAIIFVNVPTDHSQLPAQ